MLPTSASDATRASAAPRGARGLSFGRRAASLLLAALLLVVPAGATGCAPDAASSAVPTAEAERVESHLTFRTDEKLQSHFEKHGRETGCDTAEEYLAAANAVIANPESLHKLQAEDGDDLYFLERTGEFVVVSQKGYIRTYYLADRAYFDRQ